jgi:hypothetical protein
MTGSLGPAPEDGGLVRLEGLDQAILPLRCHAEHAGRQPDERFDEPQRPHHRSRKLGKSTHLIL